MIEPDPSKYCVFRFDDGRVCDNAESHPVHHTSNPDLQAHAHAFQPPAGGGEALDTKKEETSGPPAIDPTMFHGVLGEIVETADPTTEADPVGVYASLLAGAGMLLGPSPHVRAGNTRHPLLIWPLLFGRTGSGRKGEATGTAELFLLSSSLETQGLLVSGLSSGEGLIERIRDNDPDDDKDTGGTSDKRLLVVEPEFSTVMARTKREGSTLAAVLRQAWDGKPLAVLNRKALKASGSHVAIVGHITPREFRLRLAEAEMAGGTYNRFMPFYVERSKRLPIPEGVDPRTVTELGKRLRQGISQGRKRTRLSLDRSATDLWTAELYDEFTEADDEDQAWSEFARRAAPYCLRVAGLLSVLDDARLIGDVHMKAAGILTRYSIASAKHVLDGQARDPRLDRIRRAIDGAGPDGLTRTEISALFSRNLAKPVLDELLDELCQGERYQRLMKSTGGRPAERYRRVTDDQ